MRRATLAIALLLALAGCAAPHAADRSRIDPTAAGDEDRKLFLIMVRELYRHDRPQAALAFLEDYGRRYPGDPEARMLRGNALLKTGDVAGALTVFYLLRTDGYVPMADFGLGKVYAALKNWDEAARHFGKAVERAPSNPRYLNNLGYALLQLDRPEEAYGPLAQAFDLDRTNVATRNNFLLAAHRTRRRDKVERILANLEPKEHREVEAMIERWQPESGG